MNPRNPFYLLGLHPDFVASLSLEELKAEVDNRRRRLLSLYHPDTLIGSKDKLLITEREAKYKAVSNACEELEKHPENWENYRAEFTKAPAYKKQVEELEARLSFAQKKSAALYRTICSYLIGASEVNSKSSDHSALTVFNCYPGSFKMFDSALAIDASPILWVGKKEKPVFYQLELDSEGRITKTRGSGTLACPHKRLIGAISEKRVIEHKGIESILRKAQRIWTREDVFIARINAPRSSPKADYRSAEDYNPEIPLETFVNIAPLLSPSISRYKNRTGETQWGDYLFSINRRDGDLPFLEQYFFTLEGKVMKYLPPGSNEEKAEEEKAAEGVGDKTVPESK